MGRHILLADASPTIQTLVRLLVAGESVQLSFATTVQDAARLAVESGASLVLADLLLPGGGGIELARQLRDRVPVAVLVPPQTRLDPATSAAAGAIATLAKPFDRASFLALVRRTIGPTPQGNAQHEVSAQSPSPAPVAAHATGRDADVTDGALDARVAAAIAKVLEARVSGSVEAALDRALDARLTGSVEAALDRALDARVSVALERLVGERAEAIIRAELDRLLREED